MNTYECWIKAPLSSTSGQTAKVRVQANDINAARGQLVAQYGAANLLSPPLQVR